VLQSISQANKQLELADQQLDGALAQQEQQTSMEHEPAQPMLPHEAHESTTMPHEMQEPAEALAPEQTVHSGAHNEPISDTNHNAHSSHGGHSGHGNKKHKHEDHLHIPTGIYITALWFPDVHSLSMMGYIWQRYHKIGHAQVTKGLIFPSALREDPWRFSETYRFDDGEWEIIGWMFKYNIKQDFDHTHYPFDVKRLSIIMLPKDFNRGVILIPDLEAYPIINPSSLPGFERDQAVQIWHPERAYFSYNVHTPKTNYGLYSVGSFGIAEQSTKAQYPDFSYNIDCKRYLTSILLINLFPLAIVMLILFITLLMARLGKLDFGSVLGTCGAFFFTIIVAHLQLKQTIAIDQIVFFEYFFFILHFIILSVLVVSILFFLKIPVRFIQYKNMLIPLLFFWPLVETLVLTVSLIYFY